MKAILGLFIGAMLRVVVPYVRSGLQEVAQLGNFSHWPEFDWRYLAMVLLPVLEYGIAFVTIEGLWNTAITWGMIYAIQLGWSGSDIGKEIVQIGTAINQIVRK